jgi:hypothetical protein
MQGGALQKGICGGWNGWWVMWMVDGWMDGEDGEDVEDGCSGCCGRKEKDKQELKVNHDQINTNTTITNKRVA